MSNVIGPKDPNRLMWEMSLGEFLDEAVARNPSKVVVEIRGQRITYQDIQRRALQTAELFRGLGVGHGDRVTLFLPNCPEFLYCWFGLSILGAIGVPINTAYKRDETAYILNDSQAVAFVAHESLLAVADEAAGLAPELRQRLAVTDGEAQAVKQNSSDWISFGEGMEASGVLEARPQVSPGDISMLGYTSGTTGNPKGVQVTHQMYVAAGQGFAH